MAINLFVGEVADDSVLLMQSSNTASGRPAPRTLQQIFTEKPATTEEAIIGRILWVRGRPAPKCVGPLQDIDPFLVFRMLHSVLRKLAGLHLGNSFDPTSVYPILLYPAIRARIGGPRVPGQVGDVPSSPREGNGQSV